jgi:hypothetical protein
MPKKLATTVGVPPTGSVKIVTRGPPLRSGVKISSARPS